MYLTPLKSVFKKGALAGFSVVRAQACGRKGHRFDSQSRACISVASSPASVGVLKGGNQSMFLSHLSLSHFLSPTPPSLPLSLVINGKKYHWVRILFKKKKKD